MLYKRILFISALVALFMCLETLQANAANMADNAGFEKGLSAWHMMALGDKKGQGGVTSKDTAEGKKSAWVFNATPASWTFVIQNRKVKPGVDLTLTAWVRTSYGVRARVVLTDGFVWGKKPQRFASQFVKSESAWKQVKVTLKNVSGNMVCIALGLEYGSAGAQVLIDDVVLSEGVNDSTTAPERREGKAGAILVLPAVKYKHDEICDKLDKYSKSLTEMKKQNPSMKDKLDKSLYRIAELKKKAGELLQFCTGSGALEVETWSKFEKEVTEFLDQKQGVVISARRPYEDWSDVTRPEDMNRVTNVQLHGAIGEHEACVLLCHNYSGETERFFLQVLPSKEREIQSLPADHVTLFENVLVTDYSPAGKSRKSHKHPDALFRLDGMESIVVSGNGTPSGVWVQVDTNGLEPGKYSFVLRFRPQSDEMPFHDTTFNLTVHDISLPAEFPLRTFHWDYSKGANDKYFADMTAHYVNTFHISDKVIKRPGQPGSVLGQGAEIISDIKAAANNRPVKFLLETMSIRKDGWKDEYAGWIRSVVNEMEELGVPYEDWYLEIYDETLSEEFEKAAKAIKGIDHNIQIFSDHLDKLERVKALAPYVDVWCPLWGHLDDAKYADSLAFMKKSGKPVWTYFCHPTPSTSPMVGRAMPWRAFAENFDGVCMWTYNRVFPYEVKGLKKNYGLIYDNRNGPNPSRRWEAWRDGLEDYMLLAEIRKRSEADNPSLMTLVEKAVKEVLAADVDKQAEVIYNCRNKIFNALTDAE